MHYLNLTYKTNKLHKTLGTLQQPRAEIIDQRHIVIGSFLAFIPGIIFVIGSVVLLPFNLLAKKLFNFIVQIIENMIILSKIFVYYISNVAGMCYYLFDFWDFAGYQ